MSMKENKVLETRINKHLDNAIKELQTGDISKFLIDLSLMNSGTDYHITRNCITEETMESRVECIKNANNLRVKALNKIGEIMSEKCGGKMVYLKEE